jgi:hypothetical protein
MSARFRPTRRQVLQATGTLAAGAAIGSRGHAEAQVAGEPTFSIEINLCGQIDWGHVFVAPGLATNANLIRGSTGNAAALFYNSSQLTLKPNNVYLTPESIALAPHVDTIAMVELSDLPYHPVHGHDMGNPVRSPGRTLTPLAGRPAMWINEPGQASYNWERYSSTPTITPLHNYWQKQITPSVRNGVVLKAPDTRLVFHTGAGLAGSEPDRFTTGDSLLAAFPPSTQQPASILAAAEEARFATDYLTRRDLRFMTARGMPATAIDDHRAQLSEAKGLLYQPPRPFDLALTSTERSYWSAGLPPPRVGYQTQPFGEILGYAFKLIASDVVRSVAVELIYDDIHGQRPPDLMAKYSAITVLPLVRLIESLKAAGIYDRTLITVYCCDGSRGPSAGSYGDHGKNGVILAGGMIRGGYYGDLRVESTLSDGHTFRYFMPDIATGQPIPQGTTGDDRRLPSAYLHRTIARALKIPDSVLKQFPDVAAASPLGWLLR